MFAALKAAPANPYDAPVEQATAETQTSESWDQMLTIWEKVNLEGETG